ncbi:MAG: DUF1588 domain-containing protein [Rubripirellula sp.]|nr:DUF1588 domain-containing protein [Rubripirellula sp.]
MSLPFMMGRWLTIVILGTVCGLTQADQAFTIPTEAAKVINQFCLDCHDRDTSEGSVQFDSLALLTNDERIEELNKAQEQIFFGSMPPDDAPQPSESERDLLFNWLSQELRKSGPSKLEENLRKPEFGNYVDHSKLFSGDYAHLKGFTRDRRWLISEFIFDAKVNQLINHPGVRTIDGLTTNVTGDNGVNLGTRFGGHKLRQNITNPFLLPTKIGVRYYDTTTLTGGHLLTMLSNARKMAGHFTAEQTMKTHYPAMYRIMKVELRHREILDAREQFLTSYFEQVAQGIYGKEHELLLPKFARVKVNPVKTTLNSKGVPNPRETNLELLRTRYDRQDIQAIYRGIQKHRKENRSYSQIVERCERDWFHFGIDPVRVRGRVALMLIMEKRWDMDLIYEDIQKQNMALIPYRPLGEAEMQVIRAAIVRHRKPGDQYKQIISKCMSEWTTTFDTERTNSGQASDQQLGDLIDELFTAIYQRDPSAQEKQANIALTKEYMTTLGNQQAIAKLVETLALSSELVYRYEFGQGTADKHGRRTMSPRDASYALAYALTDSPPDAELVSAVNEGRLSTREDYGREVKRMLSRRDRYYVIDETVQKAGFNSSITNTPIRKLRFFREFFGYTKAMTVFKDDARFNASHTRYDDVKGRLVDEADRLVDHILQKDRYVFEELLTTEKFYVYHSGDNAAMKDASDRIRKIYDYFNAYDWENFSEEELYKHWDFIDDMKMMGTVFADFETNSKRRSQWVRTFKQQMASYRFRLADGQTAAAPYAATGMAYWHKSDASTRTGQQMRGENVGRFFGIDYANWDYPTTQPAKIAHRKGMLTHPAWLIAHSLNLENDPVRRGKWIREKLLAGTIPDVPITVDAVVPEDHHRTLRQRLEEKTREDYCWKCHQRMDPLGLPFEIYDDFGRFRTAERLEHPDNLIEPASRERGLHLDGRPTYKTLPVDARGILNGTGDPSLDGNVQDAIDLAGRLAKSTRVRQSIIRHAFRYFMGRNETLSDSKTLIDADQAYLNNDGSFDAVIVSLLTSDSFIYRKAVENQE